MLRDPGAAHINMAWRTLEEVTYPRLPSGRQFSVVSPNDRNAPQTIRSEYMLLTRGTYNLPEGESNLSHCAQYHFTGICKRGERCGFVHLVHIDPMAAPNQRAPVPEAEKAAIANGLPPPAYQPPPPPSYGSQFVPQLVPFPQGQYVSGPFQQTPQTAHSIIQLQGPPNQPVAFLPFSSNVVPAANMQYQYMSHSTSQVLPTNVSPGQNHQFFVHGSSSTQYLGNTAPPGSGAK